VPVDHVTLKTLIMLAEPPARYATEREYDELIHEITKSSLNFGALDLDFRFRLSASLTRKLAPGDRRFLPHGRGLSRMTLSFTMDWECSDEIELDDPESFSDEDVIEIERSVAADVISRFTYTIVLAMNIAHPGAGGLVGGAIVSDAKLLAPLAELDGEEFGAAGETALKLKWPVIRALPFERVWDWLMKLPGYRNESEPTPVGRAVNALSHALSNAYNSPVVLMWAMVGIEALYTSQGSGLLQQVRERTRAFLGFSPRADKLVSSMYALRSRFVHGDLDFPGPYGVGVHAPFKSRTELRDATELALALLLASIQELIRRDWLALRFSTICESA